MKNRIKSDIKTGYTERILVPVSNLVHVNELMDLAFYFHSHSELAIYPLTILNKIAGDEESMGIANALLDRKSTRLNSSHVAISYAVFCLNKKKLLNINIQ